MIEIGFGHAARDALVAGGVDLDLPRVAVPHTIDPAIVPVAADWLAATIPAG